MLSRTSSRISGALLLLVLGSGSVFSQETLQVAGPLTALDLLPPGVSVPPYSFAATIGYDPDALPGITNVTPGVKEEAKFYSAIGYIEYSIVDSVGTQIVHAVLAINQSGDTVGELISVNSLSGSVNDLISYQMDRSNADSMEGAMIRFADSSGLLVSDVGSVPPAPVLGSFSNSQVIFTFVGSSSMYLGRGQVTFIGASSTTPFEDCADQAKNHGQYVRCVSQINNLLRAEGEMTGREKGQAQKEAAKKDK